MYVMMYIAVLLYQQRTNDMVESLISLPIRVLLGNYAWWFTDFYYNTYSCYRCACPL